MSEFNEISFPSHQGLPWATSPPVIDGFTDLQPGAPLAAWRLEAGYTGGARFSYPGGGGAAYPTASFQGVRDASGDFLYLGFDIRFDPTFDENDRIMVVIQKAHSTASHSVDERRIDIQPLFSDAGAQGVDNPAYAASYHYKDDRQPQFRRVFKRNPNPSPTPPGVATWGAVPAWGDGADGTGDINASLNMAKFDVKVTSSAPSTAKNWTVELKIPTKIGGTNGGGTGWMDLTADIGLYVNMIRVCTTAGCPTNAPINAFWSTQFTWPFDPANVTTHLITDPDPAIAPEAPTPDYWDIPPSAFGLAHLLAPGAANPSRGVKFQGGMYGIGVLAGGSIGNTLDMRTVGTVNSLVARVINDHESNDAADVAATYRIAAFGIGGTNATWEMTPAPPTRPDSGPNPAVAPGPIIATGNGTPAPVDITSSWKINAADRARFGSLWSDQCLWVSLDSSSGANIVQSSVKRNLTVKLASTVDQTATISGDLEEKPADGSGEHDYWLHTAVVRLEAAPDPKQDDVIVGHGDVILEGPAIEGPGFDELNRRGAFDELNANPIGTGVLARADKPAATWLNVNVGYWRTARYLTIDGKRHAIWMTSGSFGSIIHHYLEAGQSASDMDISVELFGRGLQPTADGGATFRVPHGGQKRLVVRVRAGTPDELKEPLPPPEVPPDRDDTPTPGGGGGGSRISCLPQALAMIGLAAVVAAMYRRLRR